MRNAILSLLTAGVLTLGVAQSSFANTYTDSNKIGDWSESHIEILTDLGVIVGYPDGTFRPAANITREEMAVMLLEGMIALEDSINASMWQNDMYLYEELVMQQTQLLQALASIDALQAQEVVEKNNFVAIGLGYGVSNGDTDDVSNIELSAKLQVVQLTDGLSISLRPFVSTDATGGTTLTLDAGVTDKLTVFAGGGVAASWSDDSQLTGSDDVVGLINAGAEYDLSDSTITGVEVKLPTDGDASWDPTVKGYLGVKF